MASQQMERAVELLDPEVRAELNQRVRGCERKCSTGGRLGLFPQAWAHARQQATREQIQSQECLSRGSSTCEQKNPEGREGISVANQSGPICFFHDSTTSSSSYPSLIAQLTTVTTDHREENLSSHLPPTTTYSPGKLLRHPRNLAIVEHFSPPILLATGIHFPPILLHYQGYPKVCPDSLNLSNAGDPFAGISSLSFCSLFSPTRDLIALI
jgi:hypothetical protein